MNKVLNNQIWGDLRRKFQIILLLEYIGEVWGGVKELNGGVKELNGITKHGGVWTNNLQKNRFSFNKASLK